MIQKKRKEEIEEGILYGEIKEKAIDKSLDHSIKDGATASIAVGAGENFISAYAIAMNASNFQLGILSALPSLMPGEIISTKLMNYFSRKKIIINAKIIQAFLWIPILLVSLLFLKDIRFAPWILIIFYSLYTLIGFTINPAWSSWMKDLTNGREIGKYFGLPKYLYNGLFLIKAEHLAQASEIDRTVLEPNLDLSFVPSNFIRKLSIFS